MKIEESVSRAIETAREKMKPGDLVAVARCKDAVAYRLLYPESEMPFRRYLRIADATVEALTGAGFRAVAVPLDSGEYIEWLGDEPNTEAQRAKFVALKTAEAEAIPSAEERRERFVKLMDGYSLSAMAVAIMLKVSPSLIASYRTGRLTPTMRRLAALEKIIAAIKAAEETP